MLFAVIMLLLIIIFITIITITVSQCIMLCNKAKKQKQALNKGVWAMLAQGMNAFDSRLASEASNILLHNVVQNGKLLELPVFWACLHKA